MKQTDIDICLDALRTARLVLSEYIDPLNPQDAVTGLDRIIEILDGERVDAALSRIDARGHFKVMEFNYPRDASR
jgi:hypothetical protein